MTDTNIYRDIARRTGGDIYIGVVGPVRTGKSTFIKRFFETTIMPNVPADFARERMIDELPQSSGGRTIMTTEPKFVPEKGVELSMKDGVKVRVRLVDCVGYIVPSALGYVENEAPRMVKTPWYEEAIPFNMAAEIGTKKVITEHATIGLVVTTDGSIGEIPREEYEEAEERVIAELREIDKPFVVLLNCVYPESRSAAELAGALSEKYGASVLPVNCLELTQEKILEILQSVLNEFPLKKIVLELPDWLIDEGHAGEIRSELRKSLYEGASAVRRLREAQSLCDVVGSVPCVREARICSVELGEGKVLLKAEIDRSLFYEMLSEGAPFPVTSDRDLLSAFTFLSGIRKKYERIEAALEQVDAAGYGIVMPSIDELTLEEPEIMRQGSRYGVRLRASAPSIHLMRADIKTEVAPIVGSEKQSEDLVRYLLDGFREDPSKIWESNIFGKSLDELVNEGLKAKLTHMPAEARMKLQQTLERVINEGCSGLICIII